MLHNYDSVDCAEDEDCYDEECEETEYHQTTPPEPIKTEQMEQFAKMSHEQALKTLLEYAEKPCVTSVNGHAAHGRVLAASVNIGAREYLLKRKTKLANGVKFDPSKLTMNTYTEFLKHFTLTQGSQLTSIDIGMILATGCGEHALPVYRKVNPVVLSYGDTIHNSWDVDKAEAPNASYDFLRPQLMSFLKEMNFEPIDGGILRKSYHSVVEGLIHGFLYSNVAIISCYDYQENLPTLLQTLMKEFQFQVLFKSVEGVEVVFAQTVIEEARRYVFVLAGERIVNSNWYCTITVDEPRAALISTILLALPLLNSMSGEAQCTITKIKTTTDIKLSDKPRFIFGEIHLARDGSSDRPVRLERIEEADKDEEVPAFFDSHPFPRGSNVLLHLPSGSDSPQNNLILPAGSLVSCTLFGSLI